MMSKVRAHEVEERIDSARQILSEFLDAQEADADVTEKAARVRAAVVDLLDAGTNAEFAACGFYDCDPEECGRLRNLSETAKALIRLMVGSASEYLPQGMCVNAVMI